MLLLFFITNFCLQQGEAGFYNTLPVIQENVLNHGNLKVQMGDINVPVLEDHTILIASGLLDQRDEIILKFKDSKKTVEVKIPVCKKEYPVERLNLPKELVSLSKEELERVRREKEILDKIWTGCSERMWNLPFVYPLSGFAINDNFGRKRIINGEPRSPHTGVDIPAPEGTPVLSIAQGRVVLSKEMFFSGKSLIVDHGGCLFSMYFHMSDYAVVKGDTVKKGQIIGYVGHTGRATGPHLHFGIRYAGLRINPLSIFRSVLINYP